MARRKSLRLWIRMGDRGDYEYENNISDFVFNLLTGYDLSINEVEKFAAMRKVQSGIVVPDLFDGQNYISLYWGDHDAEWVKDLTLAEFNWMKAQFRKAART